MTSQSQPPPAAWSPQSGRFKAIVFISGVLALVAGGLDGLLFAGQLQSACAAAPQSIACQDAAGNKPEVPTAVPPVATQTDQAPPTAPTVGEVRFVTSVELNVRAQPGADYTIVLVLSRGDQVQLLGETAEVDGSIWVAIEAQEAQGWVNAKFLGR